MTREEAILRLEVLKDFSHENELKNIHEAIDMAIEALERKCGEWIGIESNEFPYNNYVGCSVCKEEAKRIVVGGKLYLDKWYDEYDYFKSEYCPNCGAKMDGGR